MKIYSYHQDIPDFGPGQVDELRLTVLWRERWTAAGFEPVILSEYDAQKHPFYEEYFAHVSKLPSANAQLYETACWLRWLALAQVGGGLLSDFDVIPRPSVELFINCEPVGALHVYQTPCCPSLAYCEGAIAEEFCREVAKGKIGRHDEGKTVHFSDMWALVHLMEDPLAEVRVVAHDVVKLWGDKGWETAPVVHFSNSCTIGKLVPRWQKIPEVLPA